MKDVERVESDRAAFGKEFQPLTLFIRENAISDDNYSIIGEDFNGCAVDKDM